MRKLYYYTSGYMGKIDGYTFTLYDKADADEQGNEDRPTPSSSSCASSSFEGF